MPINIHFPIISEIADEVIQSSAGAPASSMELPEEYPVPTPINIFEVKKNYKFVYYLQLYSF